jgi:hypothetical protein
MDEDFAQRQLALQPLFTRTARLLGQAAGLLLLANAGSDRDRQRSHLRVAHAQWQELAAAFGDLDSPRDASPSHRAIGATIQRLGEILEQLARRFSASLRDDGEFASLLNELAATRAILQSGSCPHNGLTIVDLAGACCATGH